MMTTGAGAVGTVAEAFLAALVRGGVGRLFVNAGTDFASLVEAYAKVDADGGGLPDVVVCAHENLAMGMAHGAYLATGSPQVVMVHTNVGTANAVCGVINAFHARVPILLTAGRTPLFEDGMLGSRQASIHWTQEMFDQAGLIREVVKWDYELRSSVQVDAVVDRALSIACTEPPGPVYLTLPREVMAAPHDRPAARRVETQRPTPASPNPEAVARLATALSAARFPVIAAPALGSEERCVSMLDELCARFAIAVVDEQPRFMNVRGDHPMHAGYRLAAVLAQADALCFIDAEVPWVPSSAQPADHAFVAHCGPDPSFQRLPIRGHRSDLSITASTFDLLSALRDEFERQLPDGASSARQAAVAQLAEQIRGVTPRLVDAGLDGPIDKEYLNLALGSVRHPTDIVVNEYWFRPDLVPSGEPGTYFLSPPPGGLGWGVPAALGVQLANRDAVVIATVGDGAYLFANPAACHHAMAMHGLPVLVVVCSNGKWAAVESSALAVYPEGHAAGAPKLTSFAELTPTPAFHHYATASGGVGLHVTGRSELIPALEKALAVVRHERRAALVNVECV